MLGNERERVGLAVEDEDEICPAVQTFLQKEFKIIAGRLRLSIGVKYKRLKTGVCSLGYSWIVGIGMGLDDLGGVS